MAKEKIILFVDGDQYEWDDNSGNPATRCMHPQTVIIAGLGDGPS